MSDAAIFEMAITLTGSMIDSNEGLTKAGKPDCDELEKALKANGFEDANVSADWRDEVFETFNARMGTGPMESSEPATSTEPVTEETTTSTMPDSGLAPETAPEPPQPNPTEPAKDILMGEWFLEDGLWCNHDKNLSISPVLLHAKGRIPAADSMNDYTPYRRDGFLNALAKHPIDREEFTRPWVRGS